jgi:hypothetical protein
MNDANMQLVVHNPYPSDYISRLTIVRGENEKVNTGTTLTEKRRKRKKNEFKEWCMPEQPSGYIKGRKHDFL